MQNPVAAAIRRHPLIAFFALADGMSWLAWLPYVLSRNGLGLLPSLPSSANFIITAIVLLVAASVDALSRRRGATAGR